MKEKQSNKDKLKEFRLAKARGVHMGRRALPVPVDFHSIAKSYLSHEITNTKAREILSMSKGTFFCNIKLFLESC